MRLLSSKRSKITAVAGLLAILLVVGLLGWGFKTGKIKTRADVLTVAGGPQKLQGFFPSVANDIPQGHWSYKYIEAVLKYKVPATGAYFMTQMADYAPDNGIDDTFFDPDQVLTRPELAVYATKIANIAPKSSCLSGYYRDIDAGGNPNLPWACGYIEAAADAGLLANVVDPAHQNKCFMGEENGSCKTLVGSTVGELKKILINAGYPNASVELPPEMPDLWDSRELDREHMAALAAYNMKLPTVEPKPNLLLRFEYPNDPQYGFDFGFELYRKGEGEAEPSLLLSQAPPEGGMVEEADFGLAYDNLASWNARYIYYVYLINREGEYSDPAFITVQYPNYPDVNPAVAPKPNSPSPSIKPSTLKSPTPTPRRR